MVASLRPILSSVPLQCLPRRLDSIALVDHVDLPDTEVACQLSFLPHHTHRSCIQSRMHGLHLRILSLRRLDTRVRINGSRVLPMLQWQCMLPVACMSLIILPTGLGEDNGNAAKSKCPLPHSDQTLYASRGDRSGSEPLFPPCLSSCAPGLRLACQSFLPNSTRHG